LKKESDQKEREHQPRARAAEARRRGGGVQQKKSRKLGKKEGRKKLSLLFKGQGKDQKPGPQRRKEGKEQKQTQKGEEEC